MSHLGCIQARRVLWPWRFPTQMFHQETNCKKHSWLETSAIALWIQQLIALCPQRAVGLRLPQTMTEHIRSSKATQSFWMQVSSHRQLWLKASHQSGHSFLKTAMQVEVFPKQPFLPSLFSQLSDLHNCLSSLPAHLHSFLLYTP